MRGFRHVHFIGIGGSGLSGMATILLERGYQVSGSDRRSSATTRRLEEIGARVFYGHQAENISGADLVIRSSAVLEMNAEVQAAMNAGIPVYKRLDFLSHLMAGQQGIAIAGTHGKTTTTAMVAWMLASLGLDPSYLIGSVSVDLGVNAHAGLGRYFVIEADEYDGMFLGIRPQISVVTNIEHDHPDCYPTPQDFYQAFLDFAGRLEPEGVLIGCADDLGARRLLADMTGAGPRILSYGTGEGRRDYRAKSLAIAEKGGFAFDVLRQETPVASLALQVPGEHNVRNALAALAIADVLGLSLEKAARALEAFQGTGRRFEVVAEPAGVTLIDDYAHHPTEIRVTLEAARWRFPGRRIWAVWQPHTFSRTRALYAGFLGAFAAADEVLVTEIYPAREAAPSDGFSARRIVEEMRLQNASARRVVHFSPDLAEARDFLLQKVRSGDVVIVLSAGDADQITAQLAQALSGDRPVNGKEG